ncbi:UNVERIFIED_CONTAM: hypothetical protein GTU68_019866 [Idotea baltica]|nr:hypothetical protein [Idotea baltica]
MSEYAIKVEGLSKKYTIGKKRAGTFYHSLWQGLSRIKHGWHSNKEREFWALKDINFAIKKGEIVGVIGPNGSGKSTLLKVLSRITLPSKGEAVLNGKVSSLLEVGTGFHHELTGRENVYLNGSILGMTRVEIDKNFDDIVVFSELGDFIDTPVKHYSSGMYVRLAFSVAAHLNSEILIIDEVLSVGDMAFRKKCLSAIEGMVERHEKTVLFVSHDLPTIDALCQRCMVIKKGVVEFDGNTKNAINYYIHQGIEELKTDDLASSDDGNSVMKLSYPSILFRNEKSDFVECGEDISVNFRYQLYEGSAFNLFARIKIRDNNGIIVSVLNSRISSDILNFHEKEGFLSCVIKKINLTPGFYFGSIIVRQINKAVFVKNDWFHFEVRDGHFYHSGLLPKEPSVFLMNYNWSVIS